MCYGMAAHRFHLPPYALVEAAWKSATSLHSNETLKVSDSNQSKDAVEPISIADSHEASQMREALIRVLWGESQLPSTLPTTVKKNISDSSYSDIVALREIDELGIQMDLGVDSHAYHFIPKRGNRRVVIYHEGHAGDFSLGKKQIQRLLEAGYSVVALSMPLVGRNSQPTVQLAHFGKFRLTGHNQMELLSPKKGSPVKYFIEPVVTVLNYLQRHYDYQSVSMVGISGGAWTTTIAAALDPRIQKSFPVAGSYPFYLRADLTKDWGDFEQSAPEVYKVANYLELYVLGAYGKGRKQLQVINYFDPCCFGGDGWKTYRDAVHQRVHELGAGEFDVLSDTSHRKHAISDAAMSRILEDLTVDDTRNPR